MEYSTSNKGGRKLAFENNIYIKQKVLSNGTVWGDIMGGFCPGGFCPGDFVLGGILSRGILSGGFCPGGGLSGGFCPRTTPEISPDFSDRFTGRSFEVLLLNFSLFYLFSQNFAQLSSGFILYKLSSGDCLAFRVI